MKKILTTLAFLLILTSPFAASASTTSFSPATVSVTPGQSFSVSVYVDPQETDYTAKVALSYPAGLLSVSSFSFASGWLPLSQPGYDSVDNAAGIIIKTAGYSGGFSSTKLFGTVTFTAKAAGTAVIAPTGSTQILDANNTNTFTSGGRASVSISAPQAIPVVAVPVAKPNTGTAANPSRTPLAPVKKATAHVQVISEIASSSATTTAQGTTTPVLSETAAAAGGSTREISLSLSVVAVIVSFGFGILIGKRQGIRS
ncbi:MAG: hypothetical protein JWN50_39 [Parcubacteria group bacterium]|nr:hypothetical protein [Parcubacteria group bacterium]